MMSYEAMVWTAEALCMVSAILLLLLYLYTRALRIMVSQQEEALKRNNEEIRTYIMSFTAYRSYTSYWMGSVEDQLGVTFNRPLQKEVNIEACKGV